MLHEGIFMKKTTLSLTIGLVLLSSYTSANAEDEIASAGTLPPPDENYQPYSDDPATGELPPADDALYPPLAEGEQYPSPDGDLPPPYPPLPEGEKPPYDGVPPEGYIPPPPHIEDYGLTKEEIELFNANDLGKIDPEAFRAFQPDDFANLPPEAMPGFTPDQFRQVDKETLEILSEHQFHQLPPNVMGNLNPEQFSGFKPDIVHQFRPEHFEQFKPEQFEQVDHQDIFRMIANSDPDHIKPEHFQGILPPGWAMGEDGRMEVPEGEGFALPPIPKHADLSPHVFFPEEIPDLNKGLGLGGQGEPLLGGLNQALVGANLPQFKIRQDDKGIMQVTGSEQYEGTNLAFIPDMNHMKQGAEGAVPGLTQDERGLFVLTTPDGQIIPIRPVPKDIGAIKGLIPEEGGEVKLGKDGDVFLNIPEQDGRPARCDVGIFDPFIHPAPSDLKPGIHFPEDPTGLKPAIIVYEDGTSQTMNPTVPAPEEFIVKAKEFDGVADPQYNADGSIGLKYQGQPLKLNPTFNITMEAIPENIEKVEPSITVKGDILEYRYQQGDQVAIFTVNINFL